MQSQAHAPAAMRSPATGETSQSGPEVGAEESNAQRAANMRRGGSSGANPSDVLDGDGNAVSTHGTPGVEDAVNANLESDTAFESVNMIVEVVADPGSPYEAIGPTCPRPELLYRVLQEGPEVTSEHDGPGDFVAYSEGTVDHPSVSRVPDEGEIYIHGSPSVDDIHQGTFSDCYFLASVGSVVAQQPGYVRSTLIANSESSVTVNFFRYNAGSGAWVAAPITVDKDLVARRLDDGTPGSFVGAGFRMAERPDRVRWSASVDGEILVVAAEEEYDLALWAALLEKAYASYSQRWGQYGNGEAVAGTSVNEAGKGGSAGGSGYEAINGGIAQASYNILYGGDATIGDTAIQYAAGSNPVLANQPMIENLLRVAGEAGEGQDFAMTVMTSPWESINRLKMLVDSIVGGESIRRYGRPFKNALQALATNCDAYLNAANDSDQNKALRKVSHRAHNLAEPGNWPLLHSANQPAEYRELLEKCNIVMNLGDDESEGQRYVYAWHSYSVLGASFKDSADAAIALTLSNIGGNLANIDGDKSRVDLRNPHGRNSPNEHGTADQSSDDGNFSMSLTSFLQSFEYGQHGFIPE